MAAIQQKFLFTYKEIENLEDLKRLSMLLKYLPDEKLMQTLETRRGKGRDDYPIRAMWNSILAGIVYQHPSIESLRRELGRNGELRDMCGFDPGRDPAVPTSNAYSNFLKLLIDHQAGIDAIFYDLVDKLSALIKGFGNTLAIDSKAINSKAKKPKGNAGDNRGEKDADKGVKRYKGKRPDGSLWESVKSWFGFKLHLIVDADTELPVDYQVTKASCSDVAVGRQMIGEISKNKPELLKNADILLGDKGYDDTELCKILWNQNSVKPVIDKRNKWQLKDELRALPAKKYLLYNEAGTIHCQCKRTGEIRPMQFAGFEKDRDTLKYRCPAKYQNVDCASGSCCCVGDNVRIDIHQDIRRFSPIPRESAKFTDIYKKRSSVERVNSRVDGSFCFDKHFIRGLAKMKTRCGLAMIAMLGMAYGRVREKQDKYIRSLVKPAA